MGNAVVHWQIHAKNAEEASVFYKALFGWTIDAGNALGYRMVQTNSKGGIDGGIWPVPADAPPMVQLYVEVDNVAQHVQRATDLGAKIVMPPMVLPDGDEMAVIVDPAGIPFGLTRRQTAKGSK